MKVLLTNDDGIDAQGIRLLAQVFQGWADIYVVAPDEERSSVGHGITVRQGLRAIPHSFHGIEGVKKSWMVNGTPADCVKVALHLLLDEPPDFVVSGVNVGVNLGKDIYYSGTISGAREAVIHGIPALAVSYDNYHHPDDFGEVVKILLPIFQDIKKRPLPSDCLLNINVPHLPAEQCKGVVPAPLSLYHYKDRFEERGEHPENTSYWLDRQYGDSPFAEGDDFHALKNGYVTITPIHIDSTYWSYMKTISEWPITKNWGK